MPDPKKPTIKVRRWFVLDLPPDEHPEWTEWRKKVDRVIENAASGYEANFETKWAPIFLKRFDDARIVLDQSDFTMTELVKILKIDRRALLKWSLDGVKGYGTLPRLKVPTEKQPYLDEKGRYLANHRAALEEYYYRQEDIRRFFKKEIPGGKFKTISDKLPCETNVDEIAAKEGYYVYREKDVYPMTYNGFKSWLRDKVRIRDKESGKPIRLNPNFKQDEFYKGVFTINDAGQLHFKLICVSRPRGDYKSTDVCLVALFFLFNRPRQLIYLIAANSESQSERLLLQEIKEIMDVSPELHNTAGYVKQESGIYLMADRKTVYGKIETASAKAGTLSNANIFIFTELFDLSVDSDFAKLEGSTRGTPNAFTLAESVVSDEGHIFHRLYQASLENKDPLLYFQWYGDEWHNPRVTQAQRDHYRITHGEAEYNRHFRNMWGTSTVNLFTKERIYEIGVYGIDNIIGPSRELTEAIEELVHIETQMEKFKDAMDLSKLVKQRLAIKARLHFVDDLYRLPANADDLDKLRDVFGLEYFSLGVGIDRAKQTNARSDRTAVFTTGRTAWARDRNEYGEWLAFVLDVFLPSVNTLPVITQRVEEISERCGTLIGKIDVEEYQGKDLSDWLESKGYNSELVPQSFKHQDVMFPILYSQIEKGLYKCPTIPVWQDPAGNLYRSLPPDGTPDLFRQELRAFINVDAVGGKGFYGSAAKYNALKQRKRVKPGDPNDDTVYAAGHSIHAVKEDDLQYASGLEFANAEVNVNVIGAYAEAY